MTDGRFRGLYYITHIDNIPSILARGILAHECVETEHIEYTPIYDKQIVENRRIKKAPNGRSLLSFANLYFQPRNPMLYRVVCEKSEDNIAILAVQAREIVKREDVFISTGNAASALSDICSASQHKKTVAHIAKGITNMEWWTDTDGSKRKIMAECLVPEVISPRYIQEIYVANHQAASKVNEMLGQSSLQVIPEPHMFFQPYKKSDLTPHLSVVQGDMFFSRMHTLTVSVNCVGVMGKGLASRAKYQFPDVYVYYQDLCRKRQLEMGKPYLYKRESSFDYQLADEPSILSNANSETWFLLFPTKHHWRERADIHGIERGLQWLQDNYSKKGVRSLALPALGCGLGKLEWRDVGPLLCKYLFTLNIPVWVYLPAEREIPEGLLSRDFLLKEVSPSPMELEEHGM